jgi:hypothetical protein
VTLTAHLSIHLARRLFLCKFSELTLTFIAHLPNFSLSLCHASNATYKIPHQYKTKRINYTFEYFNLCSSRKRERTRRIPDPTVASFPSVCLLLHLPWMTFWLFVSFPYIYIYIYIYMGVIQNDCRGFNNLIIRCYSPGHLVLQMQPHVISFPQVSRNWRYESEPPLKPSPLTCYKQCG